MTRRDENLEKEHIVMSKKNAGKTVTKAIDWHINGANFAIFKDSFNYQPKLTKQLDSASESFSQQLINEIVLWKINRYVELPKDLLESLNGIRSLRSGQHRDGETELRNLLACKGVRLPMASTILRFANPNVFQIFDRHICRAMEGECAAVSPKKPEVAVEKYWKFLDDLVKLCKTLGIPFKSADRILYSFDKKENPPLSETQS